MCKPLLTLSQLFMYLSWLNFLFVSSLRIVFVAVNKDCLKRLLKDVVTWITIAAIWAIAITQFCGTLIKWIWTFSPQCMLYQYPLFTVKFAPRFAKMAMTFACFGKKRVAILPVYFPKYYESRHDTCCLRFAIIARFQLLPHVNMYVGSVWLKIGIHEMQETHEIQ